MQFIDCKSVREEILDEVRATGYKNLKLVIIQTTEDPASRVYANNKVKTAASVGISVAVLNLTEYKAIKLTLDYFARDPSVTGIILQLPLAAHLKRYERELLDSIPYEKDVDGLSSESMGRLWSGKPCLVPATAEGVMRLLPEDLSGKVVTIVNRSDLIGKPLVKLLLDRNATVKVCHSHTPRLDVETTLADIVITGIGRPKFFNRKYVSYGQLWIDCGINRDIDGKLCGDVYFKDANSWELSVTPVPGGVGLLTTAELMLNVTKAYELQEGLSNA